VLIYKFKTKKTLYDFIKIFYLYEKIVNMTTNSSNTEVKTKRTYTKKKKNTETESKSGNESENKNEEVAEESSEDFLIYGNEPEKTLSPFPNSDLQTQTKNIIKQYGIDAKRLPENIVNAINEMVNVFSDFVKNSNNFSLIGAIMDKDLIAVNLLKDWIEPNKDLLLKLKDENKETEEEAKSNESSQEGLNPTHFAGRIPQGTYQHNVVAPSNNNPNIFNGGSNTSAKNIHLEMMTKAAASIQANLTANQNWGNNNNNPEEVVVVDHNKIFNDYCLSVIGSIKNFWQTKHWGHISVGEAEKIVKSLNRDYSPKLVVDGENSYIDFSFNGNDFRTDFFNCK